MQAPHSAEAEKSFIWSVFIEQSILWTTILKKHHFYVREYQKIFEAMKKLHWKSQDVIPASVDNEIWDHPIVDIDFLYDVASYVYTHVKRDTHQNIILEKYNRRKIIKWCSECLDMAKDQSSDIDDLLYKTNTITSDVESIDKTHTLVEWTFWTMIKYFDEKSQPTIQEDMWYKFLSSCLWWRRAWALYVLAWATWQGKSTFALNLAIEAVKRWTQCAFFSTEMPAHEIHTRFASREARVESWKIEKGREEIWEKVFESIWSHLSKWKAECNIYDTFSTVQNLERLIAKEASLWTKLVFIDYLQQVRVNWNQSRNLAIWDMTTMLKWMAIRYWLAIVWLSQLNRASQEPWKEPQLKDLRDSWSIEQDADCVMFVYWYDQDRSERGREEWLWTVNVWILKNRHWEMWVAELNYTKKNFLFYDR